MSFTGIPNSHDDQAHQRILHCVQKLADTQGEPMIVISQLQFSDYLRVSRYAKAVRTLPKPKDLEKKKQARGDFDLLFIHKHYGLVIAEIKSVGESFSKLGLTEQQQDDLVAERIKKALEQLKKGEEVLAHLVSDQKLPLPIRKTLVLPNELRQWLSNTTLCADDLPNKDTPWDVTDDVLEKLSQWWIRVCAGPYISMSDDTYLYLVARFAGPATAAVRIFCITPPPLHHGSLVRSLGEGVKETSRRFTRIVLHPKQLDTLQQNLPLVYLCGPPGTGKTLVLVVRAIDWLNQSYDVHVLSTHTESLAVSYLIQHQLQQSAVDAQDRVHLHVLDFDKEDESELESAFQSLTGAAKDGSLYVVVDEMYRWKKKFEKFCKKLLELIPTPRLHVWAASLYHHDRPSCLTLVEIGTPLRTPPVVNREVLGSRAIKNRQVVRQYEEDPAPLPTDGPIPRVVYHEGEGHCGASTVDCPQCGKEVALELKKLHVGVPGHGSTRSIPAPLNFCDVFLLTTHDVDSALREEERDPATGLVVNPACGVLQGLRGAGVPVRVVRSGDVSAAKDVALKTGLDEVIAASSSTVSGLEREVVVWLQVGRYDEEFGRLLAMSRTTGQLIWVRKRENKTLQFADAYKPKKKPDCV
nr:hypothetical protein BaRGS_001219 [Batillaria attramentaria]